MSDLCKLMLMKLFCEIPEGWPCATYRRKETSLSLTYDTKFKFDLQPGSLTDQVAGEHQPSDKHP